MVLDPLKKEKKHAKLPKSFHSSMFNVKVKDMQTFRTAVRILTTTKNCFTTNLQVAKKCSLT